MTEKDDFGTCAPDVAQFFIEHLVKQASYAAMHTAWYKNLWSASNWQVVRVSIDEMKFQTWPVPNQDDCEESVLTVFGTVTAYGETKRFSWPLRKGLLVEHGILNPLEIIN